MRLVTFRHDGLTRIGALRAGPSRTEVVDLTRVDPALPAEMRSFLAAGEPALAMAADAVGSAPPGAVVARDEVALEPVVRDPAKLICIGLNYRDHAAETRQKIPDVPTIFAKYPNVLIGAGAPIVVPRVTAEVDYEAELAFVIGRRGRYIAEEDAPGYVAGYTIFNDVTSRDYQRRTPQWTLGKSFDTFGPLGPALVTPDEIGDPHALAIRLSVNGDVLQESSTAEMIFSVARLVSYLSEVLTLEPGDVVSTGTPAGVGFVREPPRFLRPGDTVRIEIEKLGVLENPVVAEGV